MSRKNKPFRGSSRSSKNPQQPPTSEEDPPRPRKAKPPLRLLPPSLEKQWTAEEIWALMAQTERSNLLDTFSDTPEYWNSIAPFFPGSSAHSLRKIHISIMASQRSSVPWKKDEIHTLISSVYGNMQEPEDTPQWWGEIASNLPRRNALDCRIGFNLHGLSRGPRQQEVRQPVAPSITTDAVITSFERTSIEPLKSKDSEEHQEETGEPSVPNSSVDSGATSSQKPPDDAAETEFKGKKKKKKKKKKQQEETTEPLVPGSSTIDAGNTFTDRTSEVPLMALSKQQLEEASDQSVPSIAMDSVDISSEITSEADRKTTSKGKEKLQQQEETWQHRFSNSTTWPGSTSSQIPEEILQQQEEFSHTTSNDNDDKLPQQEEIRQHSFESSATENLLRQVEMEQHTFASGTTLRGVINSSQRNLVEPLNKNWKLEDYVLLLKDLTLNLHVDTDDACAMENIASRIAGGKTGDEVRYLILKWRPQLLAALVKADRITASSSGTKDTETSDSSEER